MNKDPSVPNLNLRFLEGSSVDLNEFYQLVQRPKSAQLLPAGNTIVNMKSYGTSAVEMEPFMERLRPSSSYNSRSRIFQQMHSLNPDNGANTTNSSNDGDFSKAKDHVNIENAYQNLKNVQELSLGLSARYSQIISKIDSALDSTSNGRKCSLLTNNVSKSCIGMCGDILEFKFFVPDRCECISIDIKTAGKLAMYMSYIQSPSPDSYRWVSQDSSMLTIEKKDPAFQDNCYCFLNIYTNSSTSFAICISMSNGKKKTEAVRQDKSMSNDVRTRVKCKVDRIKNDPNEYAKLNTRVENTIESRSRSLKVIETVSGRNIVKENTNLEQYRPDVAISKKKAWQNTHSSKIDKIAHFKHVSKLMFDELAEKKFKNYLQETEMINVRKLVYFGGKNLQETQAKWFITLEVVRRFRKMIVALRSSKLLRLDQFKKIRAGRIILRLLRALVLRRKRTRLIALLPMFASVVRLCAFNASVVLPYRSADIIIKFFSTKKGTSALVHSVRLYRRKIILLQRYFRKFLRRKHAIIFLWVLQWDKIGQSLFPKDWKSTDPSMDGLFMTEGKFRLLISETKRDEILYSYRITLLQNLKLSVNIYKEELAKFTEQCKMQEARVILGSTAPVSNLLEKPFFPKLPNLLSRKELIVLIRNEVPESHKNHIDKKFLHNGSITKQV